VTILGNCDQFIEQRFKNLSARPVLAAKAAPGPLPDCCISLNLINRPDMSMKHSNKTERWLLAGYVIFDVWRH
jgi:hypothetical protein